MKRRYFIRPFIRYVLCIHRSTQNSWNKCAFNFFLKRDKLLYDSLISSRSKFQIWGPEIAKARWPNVWSRNLGTMRSPREADRRPCRPTLELTGRHSSIRNSGTAPTMKCRTISVEFHLQYLFTNFCRLNRDAPPLNYKRLTIILEAMQSRRKIADSANTAAILFSLLSRSVEICFYLIIAASESPACDPSLFGLYGRFSLYRLIEKWMFTVLSEYSWFWWVYFPLGARDCRPISPTLICYVTIEHLCHHPHLNVHFLPQLIMSMDSCFQTA